MQLCCPSCAVEFPIEAGFADADGKRLAALFAEMEPALGRAVVGYLRLFKPAKTGLRTPRAVKLVQQLLELVSAGTVCRDERGGVRRPASPATWAAAIEQMLQGREKLVLPLDNHNYLRAIAFGLADQADAAAERRVESEKRVGKHLQDASSKLDRHREHLRWLDDQLDREEISPQKHAAEVAAYKSAHRLP